MAMLVVHVCSTYVRGMDGFTAHVHVVMHVLHSTCDLAPLLIYES